MPRRFFLVPWFLCASIPFLLAMGGGGSAPLSDTIPRPKQNHRAVVLDRQGVRTELEFVSCDGKTFLPLARGEGILMVPFDRVERLHLGEESEGRVPADVEIPGGSRLAGTLPASLRCTGATEFGNYQVDVAGLEAVTFLRP